MIIIPTQYRELVFEFTDKVATADHPSGRYDINLTPITGEVTYVPALATSVQWYLNIFWGDTDAGAPYYIRWQFYTLAQTQLHGVLGNGQTSRTLPPGRLVIDGVGSWEMTCTSSYDPPNPHLKRVTGGHVLTADTSVPTGYVYPSPYNILTVGNTYSGRVIVPF